MPTLILDGNSLTIERVEQYLADPTVRLAISKDALERVRASNEYLKELVRAHKPVYGLTTGFGRLSDIAIESHEVRRLQLNLVRSHSCAVGDPLDPDEVRAAMLILANALCRGYSGVSPSVLRTILKMLEKQVIPRVPQQGSVGASGDLAPLAHIALALIGEGEVLYNHSVMPAAKALKRAGIKPARLSEKDGLALVNGTHVMTAIGAINSIHARNLVEHADIAAAMTLEGLRGSPAPYHEIVHRQRPHAGQRSTARNLRKLLAGSQIVVSHRECKKVQDAYSLRCVPQVHGAVKDTYNHVARIIKTEINSSTDNPLVFPKDKMVISAGNFHGQPISFAMDFLGIASATLGTISERRTEHMVNPDLSGLPPFLVEQSGLNSGLMMAQVVAASLASENKILSHPASVDTIPTSANREDHVSMGMTAARKCRAILHNLESILAIEFIAAAQAIEFVRPLLSSRAIEAAHAIIRAHVGKITADRVFGKDIELLSSVIRSGAILHAVEAVAGKLVV